MKLKVWLLEVRANFLLLSLVLVLLGVSMAGYKGYFHLGYALLCLLGLVLLHISTNVFNEYWDYRTGVDLATRKTPFSGGSGVLPAKLLKPAAVLRVAIISFLLAIPLGAYFVVQRGWPLLPVLIAGALCVLFYTPYLNRLGWPELAAGLGLGALPVVGTYYIQTGVYNWQAVYAAVPSGILVHNLLFLNEFPDAEADRQGGRKTLPITMGKPRAAGFYIALTLLTYVWIAAGALFSIMPLPSLLGLLTLPFAIKAIRGAKNFNDDSKLLPALGANVMVVLLTQFLMAAGYVVAWLQAPGR